MRLASTMRPSGFTVTMPRESDSTRARMYWFLIASSRMRSRSRSCAVTVSAACRTRPSVWTCIMSELPLREMAPSTSRPSGEKTGAPALLRLWARAEYILSPGRKTGMRSSSARPMAHVPMSRSVQRQLHAPPPLEMLHKVGIAHDVQHVALGVRKGHAEAGILEQTVQGIDLLLGQRVEQALIADAGLQPGRR